MDDDDNNGGSDRSTSRSSRLIEPWILVSDYEFLFLYTILTFFNSLSTRRHYNAMTTKNEQTMELDDDDDNGGYAHELEPQVL